jgi:xanthine dehydrogenase accessory factor
MKTWAIIAKALKTHGRVGLVTVVRTEGSAPRDAGACLIVTPEGFHGTIGGGTLEWRAIAEAQVLLDRGASMKLTTHLLGPDLGQCCGGRVLLTIGAKQLKHFAPDPSLEGRIQSLELAYRMQTAAPETLDVTREPQTIQKMYGLDNPTTQVAGQRCLAGRLAS